MTQNPYFPLFLREGIPFLFNFCLVFCNFFEKENKVCTSEVFVTLRCNTKLQLFNNSIEIFKVCIFFCLFITLLQMNKGSPVCCEQNCYIE